MGYEPEAPYNRIAVGAAAPRIPEPLVDQLAPGGRLVIPLGDRFVQKLTVVEKESDGSVRVWSDIEVLFVPLTGKYGFREGGEGYEKSYLTF